MQRNFAKSFFKSLGFVAMGAAVCATLGGIATLVAPMALTSTLVFAGALGGALTGTALFVAAPFAKLAFDLFGGFLNGITRSNIVKDETHLGGVMTAAGLAAAASVGIIVSNGMPTRISSTMSISDSANNNFGCDRGTTTNVIRDSQGRMLSTTITCNKRSR